MIQRIGETLFQLGGMMFVAGLVMVKFPGLFGWFGKLPGDFMTPNVFAPFGSMIVVSMVVSGLSLFFGMLLRLIK
ncbi:MAG: DUF2905 family protein [Firmicutes bacterium]|jgi:hypothetical protein|nr:DUF2905 family protein [Bacillota bacterium]